MMPRNDRQKLLERVAELSAYVKELDLETPEGRRQLIGAAHAARDLYDAFVCGELTEALSRSNP